MSGRGYPEYSADAIRLRNSGCVYIYLRTGGVLM